jgi:hypothetical protein
LIVCLSDKKVNVAGFDPSQCEVADLDLVSAALACNWLTTAGEAIMLMVHQVVHIPTMEIDLLCPMQMRMNDVKAHECPKFMEEQPSNLSLAPRVTQAGDKNLCLVCALRGVTSCFPTRKPTTAELANCRRFDLTAEEPE